MKKRIDLSGRVFGRWTVLEMSSGLDRKPTAQSLWKCRCECGNVKDGILYGCLTGGGSKSCGCLHKELAGNRSRTARYGNHAMYTTWMSIKTRCYNANHPSYKNYGGRGITLDQRWHKFENFLKDMGDRPKGYTVEREDNNGPYSPSNCVWATKLTQGRNKRNSRFQDWKGEKITLTELARMENVAFCSLRNRIVWYRYTPEDAVNYCKERGLTFKERAISLGGRGN